MFLFPCLNAVSFSSVSLSRESLLLNNDNFCVIETFPSQYTRAIFYCSVNQRFWNASLWLFRHSLVWNFSRLNICRIRHEQTHHKMRLIHFTTRRIFLIKHGEIVFETLFQNLSDFGFRNKKAPTLFMRLITVNNLCQSIEF